MENASRMLSPKGPEGRSIPVIALTMRQLPRGENHAEVRLIFTPRWLVRATILWLACASPVLAAVAAPVLKWSNGGCSTGPYCQTGWYSSPAVADLDGDGTAEVVWGSYDVVALNGSNGSLKWRAASGQRVWPGVAVADLTGDGTLEVVVGRSGDQVTVYNRFGSVVWTRNPFGGGEVRTLAVADLETDGALEIVAGRASGGSTRQLDVFEPDGSVRPGWPARRDGEPGYGWGMYNENVAVADMNGDGFKEIFGPTDTHYITALDRGGNQLPASAIYGAGKVWSQVGVHVEHAVDLRGYANCGVEHRPNFADSAPIVADVNADGVPEIIVVGNVYNCATSPYTSLYQMPFILKLDRTRWSGSGFDWTAIPVPGPGSGPRSEDYNVIETAVPNPVAADLDGDGQARDPLPLLRREAPRLLARQDRARELAVHRPRDRERRRHVPLRERAGGGRPRRRRPGGGDLRLLAEEGDRRSRATCTC